MPSLLLPREVEHIEFEEFTEIIEDIVEAGWSVRKASPNERMTNQDIRAVFQKVDRDKNNLIDKEVREEMEIHQTVSLLAGDEAGLQVPLPAVWHREEECKYSNQTRRGRPRG